MHVCGHAHRSTQVEVRGQPAAEDPLLPRRAPRAELGPLGLDQHLYPVSHLAGLRTFLCVWPVYMIMCAHMHVQTRSHARCHHCHRHPLPPPPLALQLILLRPCPSLHLSTLNQLGGMAGKLQDLPACAAPTCPAAPAGDQTHMMHLAFNWPSHFPNQDILTGSNEVMVWMRSQGLPRAHICMLGPQVMNFGKIRCGLIAGGTHQA